MLLLGLVVLLLVALSAVSIAVAFPSPLPAFVAAVSPVVSVAAVVVLGIVLSGLWLQLRQVRVA